MIYAFFADQSDKVDVLDFIFKATDLLIFDLASPYGEEICQYTSTEEISSKFDLVNGDKFSTAFQLWSPRHKGKPIFSKVDLDPKRLQRTYFSLFNGRLGAYSIVFRRN